MVHNHELFDLGQALHLPGPGRVFLRTAGLVLAALCLLAGCQTAPSREAADVIGFWRQAGRFWEFSEDGKYGTSVAFSALITRPIQHGNYQLEGSVLTLLTSEESLACPGAIASYNVSVVGEDEFELSVVEDSCRDRIAEVEEATFKRYSP